MTADDRGSDEAGVDDLSARVAALTDGWDGVELVTMFGLPSFTAHGELFCVVSEQGISLTRLPDDVRANLAELTETGPFDADGRTVERWTTVAPDALPDDETLDPFVRASYEAAVAAA